MGELIAAHSQLGRYMASSNWIKCRDPDGVTKISKNNHDDIRNIRKLINTLKLNIILPEAMQKPFYTECENTQLESMLQHESEIEIRYRPFNINYNEKALIIMTDKAIPHDIKIGLSYGWKFLFPYINNNSNIHLILAQLEMCIESTIPAGFRNEAYLETYRTLKDRSITQDNTLVQWLCFVASRTKRFFELNKDIFATRSDKGGHTVIIDVDKYNDGLANLLNDPNYEIVNHNPLESLIHTEAELMRIFSTNFRINHLISRTYEPNAKHLAQFYGLPKVHKPGFALRPITAMAQAPGHATGKIFNSILNIIFPKTDYHIKDSYEMKEFIDTSAIMDDGGVLVSFDVVSMYTNIPRSLVMEIIARKQNDFFEKFGIGKIILNKVLKFLLYESAFFTALDNIYKQIEGLPMGGCISTTLARITMDEIIIHLNNRVKDIYFIRVFVDDTITAIKRENVHSALEALNNYHPKIKFTMENEDDNQSINFLNLTLTRDGPIVRTNWYRKYFASGRLLGFFSSHKRTTIMATAQAFIETVLKLSDPMFFHKNKPRVEQTLRDNGFPETTIISLMNSYYTLMRSRDNDSTHTIPVVNTQSVAKANPNISATNVKLIMAKYRASNTKKRAKKRTFDDEPSGYHIFPHAICQSRDIKRTLCRLKHPNVIYAESTRNTKINFVRTRKTQTPLEKNTNLIGVSKCVCRKKTKIEYTRFNQTGEILIDKMVTTMNCCVNNLHTFKEVKLMKGLFYQNQTKELVKYIQHKHQNEILCTNYSLPNYHFSKLVKKANKPLV